GCGLSAQSHSARHGPLPEILIGKAHPSGRCNQCPLQLCTQPCAALYSFTAQPPQQRTPITLSSRVRPLMRIAQSFLGGFLAYNVLTHYRAAQQSSVLDTRAQFYKMN